MSFAALPPELAAVKAKMKAAVLARGVAGESELKQIAEDGSFKQVDYASKDRGTWPAGVTVARIRALATAAVKHPEDQRYAEAFHRTLGWWLRENRSNPNWWWNAIGVPQELGMALLVAEELLTPEEKALGCERMRHAYFGETGQNRELLAWCVLHRAMLEEDAELAKKCRQEMSAAFAFGPPGGEGIMRDGIYHLHGHQPQMGGYGQQLCLDLMRYAPIFKDTVFDFQDEERKAVLSLVEDGYRWLQWKGRIEPGSVGRQIWPGAQQGRGDFIRQALKVIGENCGTGPISEDLVGFKYFSESAMAIYRATNWMASVKMTIPEVPGAERVNSDNLKGGNFADGSMFTLVTGREYDDIYPLWDNWRLLPGLTSNPKKLPWNPRKWYGGQHSPNREHFITGFGDAELAVTSFRFNDGITSYLATRVFTPEFVFTLKGGITGRATTCLEHAFAASRSPADVSPTRLMNGTIGYIVPEGCEVRREVVSGDWHEIMGGMPEGSIRKGKTFLVTYRHDQHDSISWYTLPATTREQLAAFDPNTIEVLENTATRQRFRYRGRETVIETQTSSNANKGESK